VFIRDGLLMHSEHNRCAPGVIVHGEAQMGKGRFAYYALVGIRQFYLGVHKLLI
jgi:hypothetical protein